MYSYLFGQFLLERGLINPDQLTEGLEYQRNNNQVLGELAVENGMLNRDEILQICEQQLSQDRDFGQIALEMGYLSEEDLNTLVALQKDKHLYLGEALVRLGLMANEDLKSELELFESEKKSQEPVEHVEEEYILRDDPAGAFFALVTKVLPRLTGGKVLTGGFYLTIAVPSYEYAFSQKIAGDVDLEAILLIPEELFKVMGQSIAEGSSQSGKRSGQESYIGAFKDLIRGTVQIFAGKHEAQGAKIRLVDKPRKLSREVYLAKRSKAQDKSCAEFFLINPPNPNGEFFQFNFCLFFGK
jgi:hypothetical protein